MKILPILFIPVSAWGALTVAVTGATQTQAIIQERGYSGACTVAVSTDPAFSSPTTIPDLNAVEYPGSSTDTGRADTILQSDGTRVVTIGHMIGDRALAAATTYYWQVSGCGGTVSGSFSTPTLSNGTTLTNTPPFDATQWGNLGLPAFNWQTAKTYIDPQTGVRLTAMETETQTWRTGGGSLGVRSSFLQFATEYAGGSGWTNPGDVRLGASTDATTGNTNTLNLYANLSSFPQPQPWDYTRTLTDFSVVLWGQASSSTAANANINLSLMVHGAQCGATQTVELPTGSVAHVLSGSSDPDQPFPAGFPAAVFSSWNSGATTPCIHMEDEETFGSATVSGSMLTISSPSAQQHFSSALVAGDKVFVSASSPGCANNLCTVASVTSASTLVVSETPSTTGNQTFRAYGWYLQIAKGDATGTVTIGAEYKLAGAGTPIGIQAGGDRCQAIAVTSGDGHVGYNCELTSFAAGFNYWAFVSPDGTMRLLEALGTGQQIGFDPTTAGVGYVQATNGNGGWTIDKLVYGGNYTTDQNNTAFTCSPAGDCPPITSGITVTDLMPHNPGNPAIGDLDEQIETNQGITLPAYTSSLYGTWTSSNGNVNFFGSSGCNALFVNVYAGQGQPTSGGPGWAAIVDVCQFPAVVKSLIHTLDGTGCPYCRYGSMHSASAQTSRANTMVFLLDNLNSSSTSTLHGGPYQFVPTAILEADGVTWNTNTALTWPSSGIYGTCPTNIYGYTTCVTIEYPTNGPCNVFPTSTELANFSVCPWNASYTQYPVMQAGDNGADLAASGGSDSEHFVYLGSTVPAGATCPGGHSCGVFARNSTYEYCSISPWHGLTDPLSAQSSGQLVHSNGWTFTMMPGSGPGEACGAGVILQDESTGNTQQLGHTFSAHFLTGVNANGINFVTQPATIYNSPFASLGQIPPLFNAFGQPRFQGNSANIGANNATQSYTDQSNFLQGISGYAIAQDTNAIVGCGAEQFGCGPVRNVTHVNGNVYTIQPVMGSGAVSPSETLYKTQPMVAIAGRFGLQDVSGPSSDVTAAPYTACQALHASECYPGSSANTIYVNVQSMYDPGFWQPGESWANNPGVSFGNNAPGGFIRQYEINISDLDGSFSRGVSAGYGGYGRQYPFTHATMLPSGAATMLMGVNSIQGHTMAGFVISLPTVIDNSAKHNGFQMIPIQLPPGQPNARIEFGYSRYTGPNGSPSNFYCTGRAEACVTDVHNSPFAFLLTDSLTATSCNSGCTIPIPVTGPNLVFYRVQRSSNGIAWTSGDTQALAVP